MNTIQRVIPCLLAVAVGCGVAPAQTGEARKMPPLPSWYPEYVADCVTIIKKDLPGKTPNGVALIKYTVRLADSSVEEREVGAGSNKAYESAAMGEKVCSWPVGAPSPLSNDNLYLRRVAAKAQK